MLVLVYFDWNGTYEQLKAGDEPLKDACAKHGAKYMGLFRPPQVPYNYCRVFETDSQDKMPKIWKEVWPMEHMGHNLTQFLWPAAFWDE